MISPALQAAFDDGVFVAVEEPVWHSKIDIDGTFVYKKGTKKLVGRMQSINQWSIMATCKFHTCTKCICWVSIPKRFQTEDRKSDLKRRSLCMAGVRWRRFASRTCGQRSTSEVRLRHESVGAA